MRINPKIKYACCYKGKDGQITSFGLDRGYERPWSRRWDRNRSDHGTYRFWSRHFARQGSRLDSFSAGDYGRKDYVIGGYHYNVPRSKLYPAHPSPLGPETVGEDKPQCDCENPEPSEGVALVSEECPIHGGTAERWT